MPVDTPLPEAGAGVETQADLSTQTELTAPPAEVDAVTGVAVGADVAADTQPVTDAEATAEAQATNDPAQVAAFVAQEFPNRDADGDGELSQAEFAEWIVPMFTAQFEATLEQAEIDVWAESAFIQADIDSSSGLSPTELTGFLAG